MCGILAVFNSKKLLDTQEYYNKYLKIINHRGPDASNFYISNNVFLGFNRLKILDLSDNANMPMVDTSNRFILVFNGEIYNFKYLKSKFLSDYKFKSTSDSEVILAGYQKFGKEFFKKMSGMWSLIIYDKLENKFIISRDRFGIKPLYYCKIGTEYYFASEQKVLIEIISSKKKSTLINFNYVANYILYGNCDFRDETFFKEIKLIKEASIYEIKTELKLVEKYYSINFSKKCQYDEKEFNDLFTVCLSEHLNSDVNIASTLSSGIDSSCIFHTYKNFFKKKIMPFSLKFDFIEDQELKTILDVSNKYRYKNEIVEVKKSKLKHQFDHFLDMMDEPFVSDNLIYQSILTEEVRKKGNKVLYVGDGADEFFLGYDKYFSLYLIYLIKKFQIFKLFNFVFNNKIGMNLKNVFSFIFNYFSKGHGKRSILINKYGKKILNKTLKTKEIFDYYKIKKDFNNLIEEEIYSRFKYDIIKFNKNSDITGMMNSVEVRVPYLDHRIVNYLVGVNLNIHFKNLRTKNILKNFSQDHLPKEIKNQNKKYKKPGSIKKFVYEILDQDILRYLKSDSNSQIFNKDILYLYLKDKNDMNEQNAFIWFRYYQVNKLIELKNVSMSN